MHFSGMIHCGMNMFPVMKYFIVSFEHYVTYVTGQMSGYLVVLLKYGLLKLEKVNNTP
jgi:hypothetical protein